MSTNELKKLSDVIKEYDKNKYFTSTNNEVPEHVKNYDKYNFTYKSSGNGYKAWF